MNAITSLLSAFGLSTAAGLNAYLPLLTVGLLARYTNLIQLGEPYKLLTNPLVLLVIAVLALLDFIGDKIPAVDHVLHTAGLIIAPVAGAILFLSANSAAGSVSPLLAAICGIAVAGATHSARATARPLATFATAGVANPVISFMEDASALVLSVLAIILPVLAFLLVLLFAGLMFWLYRRLAARRAARRRSA
ncbi:MAG TPA: DUF4126 domain-containing protein [Kouleothrix sp.]|uniref:DUF4126 domain-containing protein n=1 Tax=Kouleothrix sp. TaxID=2779161 RepID=UPI002BC03B73|nr:DUF4126 domain-containing protein [Kouleothrix sp.]HRC76696.1 DUF4126 domain-containing protein [Kouleothrix sp.]